jgi:hypothetical protein
MPFNKVIQATCKVTIFHHVCQNVLPLVIEITGNSTADETPVTSRVVPPTQRIQVCNNPSDQIVLLNYKE